MADRQMPWYRMYTEARNDAKLRALTKPQHYVWFNLLCLSAEQDERGAISGYDDELLAIEVADGDVPLLQETIERLIKLRILVREDDGVRFKNFMERYGCPDELGRARGEWNALRASVTPIILKRDGHQCRYCSATRDLTIDHVIPLARGGSNEHSNLVIACRTCNSSKGARALEEWRA